MKLQLQVAVDEGELLDVSSDLEALLDLDSRIVDFSPAMRRMLYDLEDGFAEALADASTPPRMRLSGGPTGC